MSRYFGPKDQKFIGPYITLLRSKLECISIYQQAKQRLPSSLSSVETALFTKTGEI